MFEELSGPGPFTVFAPSETAFDKIPRYAIFELLRPDTRKQLLETMRHHVVRGKMMTGDVRHMTTATTLQGQDVRLESDHDYTVNGAKFVIADIECSNGVIHVIDTVIPPL